MTKLQRWKLIKRSKELLKSFPNNHVYVEIDSDSDGEYEATDFNCELHIEDSAESDGEEARALMFLFCVYSTYLDIVLYKTNHVFFN